ncbi:unnamed protein product [Phytomonas sp. EM1]|nr:unnamed protein product [Phytomonas sp. EM1]|eukprot:CCW64614.1 unnamed protein product [Phytomonas sp. isolate EM1]
MLLNLSFASVPLRLARQIAAFASQSSKAIWDPTNADAVAAVGELSALNALEKMKARMMADLTGRAILLNQPLVTDELLAVAERQPGGTFGHRYASYMNHNKFNPDARTPVTYIADPTLRYIMTRYRQCHDFMHTLTGCGRTVEEELAVKILEWRHTGLPLGLLSLIGGGVYLTSAQRQNLKFYWEWGRENAPRCIHGEKQIPFYLNIDWEEMISKPFDEVVFITGITPLAEYLQKRRDYNERAGMLNKIDGLV